MTKYLPRGVDVKLPLTNFVPTGYGDGKQVLCFLGRVNLFFKSLE